MLCVDAACGSGGEGRGESFLSFEERGELYSSMRTTAQLCGENGWKRTLRTRERASLSLSSTTPNTVSPSLYALFPNVSTATLTPLLLTS